PEVARQLHVVLDRLERLLVAEEPDEADARARDELEKAVQHPHPGAQYRADGELLARDPLDLRPLERRLHTDRLLRDVLRRLVREERGQLADEPAEVARRRSPVAQVRQLVPDERVVDMDDLAHALYVVYPRNPGYNGRFAQSASLRPAS